MIVTLCISLFCYIIVMMYLLTNTLFLSLQTPELSFQKEIKFINLGLYQLSDFQSSKLDQPLYSYFVLNKIDFLILLPLLLIFWNHMSDRAEQGVSFIPRLQFVM